MYLGRRVPTDFEHVEKYPLTVRRATAMRPTPVGLGISWYDAAFSPEKIDGAYWILTGKQSTWGSIAGGHAIPCKPLEVIDLYAWHVFYDQYRGSCTGHDVARIASLLYRKQFDPEWAYEQAQLVDEFDDTPPEEGSSVRASFDVARTQGLRTKRGAMQPVWTQNRWPRTVEEVTACLARPGVPYPLDYVILLQSWGLAYPHYVRLPLDSLAILLDEDGEAAAPILPA